jgi:putative transcriptional regulator
MKRSASWNVLLLLMAGLCAGVAPALGAESRQASLTGKLLIAAPSMPDPRFQGTVIYMCDHSEDGALGLVINRAMATVPGAVIAEQFGLEVEASEESFRMVWGGPVELGRGFVLHSTDYMREDSVRVDEGVALTTEPGIVADMIEGKGPKRTVFALGYAGWSPGQLESELSRDDWITVPVDADFIFGEDLKGMWEAALALLSVDL